jgi:hypothetical protein
MGTRFRRGLAAVAVALAAATAAGGVAATSAHAASAPAITSLNGVAGYEANEINDGASYLTHASGQFGLGNPQYGADNPQIPNAVLSGLPYRTPVAVSGSFPIPAAYRLGLDDGNGANNTAMLAIVPTSTNFYDVLAVLGTAATVGGKATISAGTVELLLRVPSSHTTELDVLYDGLHNYDGFHAGTATFYTKDLSAHSAGSDRVNLGTPQPGKEFFRAQVGVVNYPQPATFLSGTPPLPDSAVHALVVSAHVFLNGNTIGGPEFEGTFQSGAAWTVTPVTAVYHTKIGAAVSVFRDDHFTLFAGQ